MHVSLYHVKTRSRENMMYNLCSSLFVVPVRHEFINSNRYTQRTFSCWFRPRQYYIWKSLSMYVSRNENNLFNMFPKIIYSMSTFCGLNDKKCCLYRNMGDHHLPAIKHVCHSHFFFFAVLPKFWHERTSWRIWIDRGNRNDIK